MMVSHAQTIDIDDHCYVMRNNDKNVIFLHSEKIHADHIFSKILKDKNVSYSLGEVVCLCITGMNNLEYVFSLDSRLNINVVRLLYSSFKDVLVDKLESYLQSIENYMKKQVYSGYSSIFLNESKIKIMLYIPTSEREEDSKTLSFPMFSSVTTTSLSSKYQLSDFKNIGKFLSPKVKWSLYTTIVSFD